MSQGSLKAKMFTKGNALGAGVAVGLGLVDLTYKYYLYETARDPLTKNSIAWDAAGSAIDTGISAIPYFGGYIMLSWAVSSVTTQLIMKHAFGCESHYGSMMSPGQTISDFLAFKFGTDAPE